MSTQLRASSSHFSDSPSTHSWKHDVFLSFRGEDTRNNFTGHLHSYLVMKGINTFIDNNLTRGEEISQALLQAIEGSKISIIVFSENYASSKWCLDELVHILECKRSKQHLVRPVFYKVDPSDIRNHKGTFGKALANHECRFNDKMLIWKTAMTEAANLSGWTLMDGCSEAEFIHRIVVEIVAQVNKHNHLDVAKYPTGIHSRVKHIVEMLDIGGSDDTRMIGIWGTGGIGKTTIAKGVYNSIAHKFEESFFLLNIKEDSIAHGGLVNLQNIILSKLIRGNEVKAANVDEGITLLIGRLRHKRILLILDDVNQLDQLNKLAGATDWFGRGSRIIITTRDKHLLITHQVNSIYKASELYHGEALTLFCSHAFKDNRNLDDGEKLIVDTVVEYARGLPLALEVLGSHLCGRPIHQWHAVLDGYRRVQNPSIHQLLKISYDGLEETEREVFLDIAFFFKGRNTNNVIAVLEGCGRINAEHCIAILKENALMDIDYDGHIHMHDLLVDMGKEIVRQESPKEPGKRSRLWCEKDVRQVLTKDAGTEKIEGIIVTLSTTDEIYLSPTCFKKMKNLAIFINTNARFCGIVDHLPEELRFLDWHQCPLKNLPSNFYMKNLIELNMSGSRISHLWKEFKSLPSLTVLNLRECKYLVKLPDLSGSPNLRTLSLNHCTRLVEVHPSVGLLKNLEELDLGFCRRLEMLPSKVNWTSMGNLRLDFCYRLENFPEIMGEMKHITSLYLTDTPIKEFPLSIGFMINLERLSIYYPAVRKPRILKNDFNSSSPRPKILSCRNKASNESSLALPGLRQFTAVQTPLPDNHIDFLMSLDCASTLHKLDLSRSNIVVLYKCISKFVNLSELDLTFCENLVEIQKLPPRIVVLNVGGCSKLGKISKLSNILKRKESQMIKKMYLGNCLRLCENLIQELQKKNLSANDDDVEALLSLFLSSQEYGFEIYCPGSVVPKWFSCQMDFVNGNLRFECDIEILPHFKWENTGLALCVAAADQNLREGHCNLKVGICITGELVSYKMEHSGVGFQSGNLWLCYVPFRDMWQSGHASILPPSICQVTIEPRGYSRVPMKSCGVHLVMPPNEDICMKLSSTGNERGKISNDVSKWTRCKTFTDVFSIDYKVSISEDYESDEDLKDDCSTSELQYSG